MKHHPDAKHDQVCVVTTTSRPADLNGKKPRLGPYFTFEKFRVVVIEVNGVPTEFIQSNLGADEVRKTPRQPA